MKSSEVCSACGGSEHLRHSPWHGDEPICKPCFMVWYDLPTNIDTTSPAAVGAESLRLKALGKWPWPWGEAA